MKLFQRLKIAARSSSIDDLTSLSNDKSAHVRAAVARNKHTTTELLTTLSSDNNYYVLIAVAKNIHTSPDVLLKLSQKLQTNNCCEIDNHDIVQHSIRNNSFPLDELINLSKLPNNTVYNHWLIIFAKNVRMKRLNLLL